MDTKNLQQEWQTLQRANDNFEAWSLGIKLVAILVLFIAVICEIFGLAIALIIACLWLQDAIWKTFQSRHESRLLEIEKAIVDGNTDDAFQFNLAFAKTRPGTLGLLNAYLRNALRPTVAFPYVFLIVLTFLLPLLQ